MSQTDAVAATGTVLYATTQSIPLNVLFKYYEFQPGSGTAPDGSPADGSYLLNAPSVLYFSGAVYTNDGSYLLGPNGREYHYGSSAFDININELDQFSFVPSGSAQEVTLIKFNAETSDISYSRPATSVVLVPTFLGT
ncbi:hypothetical protein [Bradyrhizobium liaoningense]|uniref:hypothetical protein n=1 Tax=Bradyrhizobium liaoningense TaxID=43992 RepID=UPI001BAB791D|nr:hypothetical protein [Bradyrhizobium liaoningense]MBR1071362.1 hypothetical protein [Bradyrhizobium liaoningense]